MVKEQNKKTILVADDDAGIVDVLTLILEDAGYAVRSTVNGAELMSMKETLPDLVLLDLWMSGVDGSDICKFMKDNNHTKDVPVIIITANRDTEKIAKQCGADDFLAKPFDMDDLLEKVKQYIG